MEGSTKSHVSLDFLETSYENISTFQKKEKKIFLMKKSDAMLKQWFDTYYVRKESLKKVQCADF